MPKMDGNNIEPIKPWVSEKKEKAKLDATKKIISAPLHIKNHEMQVSTDGIFNPSMITYKRYVPTSSGIALKEDIFYIGEFNLIDPILPSRLVLERINEVQKIKSARQRALYNPVMLENKLLSYVPQDKSTGNPNRVALKSDRVKEEVFTRYSVIKAATPILAFRNERFDSDVQFTGGWIAGWNLFLFGCDYSLGFADFDDEAGIRGLIALLPKKQDLLVQLALANPSKAAELSKLVKTNQEIPGGRK